MRAAALPAFQNMTAPPATTPPPGSEGGKTPAQLWRSHYGADCTGHILEKHEYESGVGAHATFSGLIQHSTYGRIAGGCLDLRPRGAPPLANPVPTAGADSLWPILAGTCLKTRRALLQAFDVSPDLLHIHT